jgi:hypothetical protein
MQIVNGYICMNCCDVDKARLGQDPHQQTNQIQKQLKQLIDPLQKQLKRLVDPSASARLGPAVTFGGSLQASAEGNAATAVGSSQTTAAASGPGVSNGVNVLA